MHAGKLVNYISEPVMGGFITGICTTIILMQVPKLMGGSAGTGEFLELAEHIIKAVRQINMPSLVLGSVFSCDFTCSEKACTEVSDGGSVNGIRCSSYKHSSNDSVGN